MLALKGNQGNLHDDVQELFTSASEQNFKNIEHHFYETVEKGHGRMETRRYWTMANTEYLIGAEKWKDLRSVGMVESQRTINGTTSTKYRYYLLSLENDVHKFAESVRNHWSIENQLHWVLDVGFNEDASQCCRGYSAENLAVIRHIGLNLLSRDKKLRLESRLNYLKRVGTTTILRLFLSL